MLSLVSAVAMLIRIYVIKALLWIGRQGSDSESQFYFDADPDPDWHRMNADPDLDPTQSFTNDRKS
jgi:hypothetical protein